MELVAHAWNVVANSKFAQDNAQDPAIYQTAVRCKIITLFQCLCVSLLVLDTLMESYIGSSK